MDFALTSEQANLKQVARQFLTAECPLEVARAMAADGSGCPPVLWRKMADLGWMALPFPETYGGAEGSILDLALLLEEMGRIPVASPLLTSILGGILVLETGTNRQKEELLPRIASGDLVVTLAVLESALSFDLSSIGTTATQEGAGYRLTGTKLFVPDVHLANLIICVARTTDDQEQKKRIILLLVEIAGGEVPGVRVSQLPTIAGDQQFEVVFDGVSLSQGALLGTRDDAPQGIERTLQVGAVGKCAELVGGAQKVLEMAIEQCQDRVQFDRPIGSFQALQHHCANMIVDIDLGRFLTYQAAWALSERRTARKQVSSAKAFVGDAYLRVVTLGHQILGGNGLIDEHRMPLFSKRAPGWKHAYGSPDYHRELVVRELGI